MIIFVILLYKNIFNIHIKMDKIFAKLNNNDIIIAYIHLENI